MDVKVNGKENDLASLFADEDYKQSVSLTRLLALAPGQLLYSTGMQCAILDISSALFTTPLPERITLSPKESVKSVDDKDRAGLMESCLDILNEGVTSEGGTTVERCTSLFQKILPLIRYLGTSQQELFLIQTFLGRFFHIASPTCEEDWSVLWSLSLIVQKILAKRSRDNSSVFTDEFFLHLYNEFKSSGYKTTETEKMVRDGAEERVSSEMKKMVHQSKWDSTLSPETRLVLEGLYSGEPIVPSPTRWFAGWWKRIRFRMVLA
ncbi:hypothetical protein AGDE_14825 [Angomonas deanei]|uniref:Uncharacterized protein n=1 Tax=Angomonas deanei TaxID=59799 RepID=A0A7G2CK83_9TRYP|nr:hypothetical protein AGDE_14825 [Angomonas deanei]CAD2220290.1 hypothetical protein, conserved [Angomonas deanei]|eukprot:EPY20153.1 hypothetical protein AGDE_14825 [Angomonas deanei]